MIMPIRRWKQGLAAGILLIGADSTFGQAPMGTPLPNPPAGTHLPGVWCATSPAVCATPRTARPTGRDRVHGFFRRIEGPEAQPFGMAVTSHFEGHVMAGTAARMVFHDYDFLPGSDRLNYRGVDQVYQVARLMGVSPAPVVVERMPRDPNLAERRRVAVLAALASVDPSVSPARVVVAEPVAFPLRGSDAELIYRTMVRQTETMGYLPGSSTNSSSGGFDSGFGFGSVSPGVTTPSNGR
jgi:hypothetical protein